MYVTKEYISLNIQCLLARTDLVLSLNWISEYDINVLWYDFITLRSDVNKCAWSSPQFKEKLRIVESPVGEPVSLEKPKNNFWANFLPDKRTAFSQKKDAGRRVYKFREELLNLKLYTANYPVLFSEVVTTN